MLRMLLAVIAGYVVFAGSTVALFVVTGLDPHLPAHPAVAAGCTLYGVGFALLAGWVAATIDPPQVRAPAALASIVALGAIVSIATRPGTGAVWSQLAALVLMAPAVFAGGLIRMRHDRGRHRL